MRQPPAYDKSLNPMSDEDVDERMMKLDAYDAQRTRENNGKHARMLLELAKEGKLAARGGEATAPEVRVPGGSLQSKTKVRAGRPRRFTEPRTPVVEGVASTGMAGLPTQDDSMPAAAGVPGAARPPPDALPAKRQRRAAAPAGPERSGGQSSLRNSAAEQMASAGIVRRPLGSSSLHPANPVVV